ncbi:hypothetical protein GCM10011390_02830 [Aureimonas endophytica]|uniref:Uncharacterized protein n=1 Tax=Aureimonas endophytica TaxID=2027858 RepID=A0A917DZF9_9HYPH|nr:hypothetical protein [Aureimonas endophytica]GGD87566.1 hypothetical protein GCM10011390_02830 [Aureimonas endophytica]
MGRIKNDPTRYATRTSLVVRAPRTLHDDRETTAGRERDFLTAPIDDNLYVSFRPACDVGERKRAAEDPKKRR